MHSIPANLTALLATGTLHEILVGIAGHFGCGAGTIHLTEGSVLNLAAHLGIPEAVVQIIGQVPIGKGIAGLAAERREPVALCNLQTDTSGQARPAARSTGMEGSIAVPMLAGEQLKGVLGIAKAEAHEWSDEEKSILLEMAAAIAGRAWPA